MEYSTVAKTQSDYTASWLGGANTTTTTPAKRPQITPHDSAVQFILTESGPDFPSLAWLPATTSMRFKAHECLATAE